MTANMVKVLDDMQAGGWTLQERHTENPCSVGGGRASSEKGRWGRTGLMRHHDKAHCLQMERSNR